MLTALESLLPVLLVIGTGWVLTRFGIVRDAQRGGIERLAYFVLFPCLIVATLSRAELALLPWEALGATLFLSVITMAGLCLLLRRPLQRLIAVDGPGFTSLFQGATRWNTFIALALSGGLFGAEGLALVSVAMVAMIPVLNVLAVIVLARYAGTARPPLFVLLREIARNPLIAACAIGLAFALLEVRLGGVIGETVDIFGRAALGVGLVVVGAGLDISALRRPTAVHVAGTVPRLLVMPVIGILYALAFGLEGTAVGTAIIALAVPTAANAYVLAREMGGDDKLMAEIITLQTVCAVVTLPLWIAVASAL